MLIPSILVDTYMDYAEEQGVDLAKFCSEQNIVKDHVELTQYFLLLDWIGRQLPDHDLGEEIGWRFTSQLFDPIGTAIISSETLSSGLDVALKYWDVFGIGLALLSRKHGNNVELEIQPTLPINEKYQKIILKSAIICLYKIILQILPFKASDIHIFFKGEKNTQDFPSGIYIVYLATEWKIRFPEHFLAEKSFCANKLSFERAITHCEQVLAVYHQNQAFDHVTMHTLNDIAQIKSVSTKTVYRQLKQQGQNFQKLQQSKKYTQAMMLLNQKELSIEKIAETLGYQDPSNFTRAFKRWAHVSPSLYRKQNA